MILETTFLIDLERQERGAVVGYTVADSRVLTAPEDPGRYRLTITVTDRVTGKSASTERVVVLRPGGAAH